MARSSNFYSKFAQILTVKRLRSRWFFIASFCSLVSLWTLFKMDLKHRLPYHDIQLRQNNIPSSEVPYNLNNDDTLLDLQNFKFIMNNASICTNSAALSQSSIAIIVHTARSHFNERYAIRNTWGSIKLYKGWHLHLAFLLGSDATSNPELEAKLWEENKHHGDMIMGNFVDSYRNLTYKHLMGYKWVNTFCINAKFILKTDDDMYIDIFQLVEVILPELSNSRKTYSCQNMVGNNPVRDLQSPWYVTEDQYPGETYPEYCSGSSYLMKSDGAAKIYSVCNATKFLFIDDVFVTGILRENYNILVNNTSNETVDILSLYYQHDLGKEAETENWCNLGMETKQLKTTFILFDKDEIIRDMFCIWNKVRLMKFAMNSAVVTETN